MVHKMLWPQGQGKTIIAKAISIGFRGEAAIINSTTFKEIGNEESSESIADRIIEALDCIIVDHEGLKEEVKQIVNVLEEKLQNSTDKFLLIFKTPELDDLKIAKVKAENDLARWHIQNRITP